MLELMNYRGCGNCEKCDDEFNCKAHTVPVSIKFNRPEKWDDWGHMVTAFKKGDVVKGEAVIVDEKVYCASAISPYFDDVEDFVSLDNVEITQQN